MKIIILVMCLVAVFPLGTSYSSDCQRSYIFAQRMIFKSAVSAEAAARRMNISGDPNKNDRRDVANFTVDLFSFWFAFHRRDGGGVAGVETVDSLRRSARRVGVHTIAKQVLQDLRNPVGDDEVMRNKLSILMLPIPENIFLSNEKYNSEINRFSEWIEHGQEKETDDTSTSSDSRSAPRQPQEGRPPAKPGSAPK